MSPHQQVGALLDEYFAGLYTGDVSRLGATFHPQAVLFGQVREQPYHKRLAEYLEVVRDRTSPEARGERFAMRAVSIEVHGAIALAVVRCPMLGFDYVDFLSLRYEDERWAIVSKVFTHLVAP